MHGMNDTPMMECTENSASCDCPHNPTVISMPRQSRRKSTKHQHKAWLAASSSSCLSRNDQRLARLGRASCRILQMAGTLRASEHVCKRGGAHF